MTRTDSTPLGFLVRQQCLTPNNFDVVGATRTVGFRRQTLNIVVANHVENHPNMAVRLAKAFRGSDGHWMQLQLAYDLAEVRKRANDIQVDTLAPAPNVRAVTQQGVF